MTRMKASKRVDAPKPRELITTLSDEQRALFPAYVERFIKIGLCTDPADRPRAEAAITQLYAGAKLAAPKFIWMDSPLAGVWTAMRLAAELRAVGSAVDSAVDSAVRSAVGSAVGSAVDSAVGSAVGSAVRSAVGSAVDSAVGSAVGSAVDSAVGSAVRSAVRSAVGSAVRSAVGSAVGSAVRSAVDSAVRSAVDSAVRSAVDSAVDSAVRSAVDSAVGSAVDSAVGSAGWAYWGGSLWPAWSAYLTYFRELFGLGNDIMLAHCASTESCGYWWGLDGYAIVTERPKAINMRDGALHNDAGMAIEYRDGWGLYAIGGVVVDEQIVLRPETQSLAQIEGEANAEVRRVRIERFGWPCYLAESGAKVVGNRRNERDGQPETLYALKDKTKRFVCVDPSTGRMYALGVPADIKTCEQAQNWMSHNLDRFAIHRS